MKKKLNKQTCESRNKTNEKTKIMVSRQQLAHTRTSLRTHNQVCVRRQDYAYAGLFLPGNPKSKKIGQNLKTKILAT